MLIGEYSYTIDSKKRLAIPAKFRPEIGKKVVITYGLDNCLFVYPMKAWEAIVGKLAQLSVGRADSRGFNRFMLAGAVEADVDSMGRVLLPDFLRQYAVLRERVVITGVSDRAEIWDESKWKTYKAGVQKRADELAEKLGEVGMI